MCRVPLPRELQRNLAADQTTTPFAAASECLLVVIGQCPAAAAASECLLIVSWYTATRPAAATASDLVLVMGIRLCCAAFKLEHADLTPVSMAVRDSVVQLGIWAKSHGVADKGPGLAPPVAELSESGGAAGAGTGASWGGGQGLTLVHFSAQAEPFLSPKLHENTQHILQKCSR